MKPSPYSNDEYTLGWICALSEELMIAMAMLDEEHGQPQSTPRDDTNAYHLGKIGGHNVVMACLSGGQMGTGPAAIVAENMRRTFNNIRFALLVGIGGGVPSKKRDIRLGDVVVSYPCERYPGIVQYDYGKLRSNGDVERKGWFCMLPPPKVLAAVDLLKVYHERPKKPINNMLRIVEELGEEYAYPDDNETSDRLYEPDYNHDPKAETCDSCDAKRLIPRKNRNPPHKPCVHYGIIASGSMVIKNGVERDKIDKRYENSILCFEMEAAGLMNNFPCLVIRGISDYSDSHKNDKWRKRAVGVASAYAKELLSQIEPSDVEVLPPIVARMLDVVSHNTKLLVTTTEETRVRQEQDMLLQCERWLKPPNARAIQQDQVQSRLPGTCDWIWTNATFTKWNTGQHSSPSDRIMCIYGLHGCGKSTLASSIVDRMWKSNINALYFAFSDIEPSQQKLCGLIRSLLWQLLEFAPRKEALGTLSSLMLRGQPVTSELWVAFKGIAAYVTKPVYCIVDGVDESRGTIQELFQKLFSFLDARSNFRFILLGRPHAFQEIRSIHRLEIDPALTEGDIDTIIRTGISGSKILSLPKLRDIVSRTLREKSDGNFLWVKLMLRLLSKSLAVADASERLHNLPRDLEAAYEDILLRLIHRLEKIDLDFARKVMAFIIVSQRPLSLSEFQHLLAIDSASNSARKELSFEDHIILQLDHRILDVCGDLINIADDRLRLVHFSIKEFLIRPESQWPQSREIMVFRVFLEDAHRLLGAACIEYLETSDYGSPLHDWDISPEPVKHHYFLAYASRYLFTHIYQSGLPSAFILEKIDRFLNSDRWISWLELSAMNIVEDESLHSQVNEFEKFVSWLDKGWHSEKLFLRKVSVRLQDELVKREQQYGQNNLRTEQLRLFLSVLGSTVVLTNAQVADFRAVESSDGPTDISPILQILQNEAPLPLRLQVDLLLRMQFHLQKVKRLTDPLQILFRIILQKAAAISIYVLLPIGYFYRKVHKFEQALEIYSAAFKKIKKKEVEMKFRVLDLIGATYSDLGQYEQALETYGDALAGWEKVLGPEHEHTLCTLSNIGTTYSYLQQYNKALEFLTRALTGREKVLGPEHEDTLWTFFQIGTVYDHLQQYDKALEFLTKSLTGREKVLGPEHKSTLRTLSRIGTVYDYFQQYDKALEFLTRSLTGREKVLGPEHEDTLWTFFQIGTVYDHLQQYDKALEFLTRALRGQEKVLKLEHESTLWTLFQIGTVYDHLQQYDKALEFLTKSLTGREKVLGLKHNSTLWTLSRIGTVYDHLQQYDKVLEFLTRALTGQKKVLGPEHKDTLWTSSQIGTIYDHLQQYDKALEFLTRALTEQEKVLGPEHEDTLWTLSQIGTVYDHLQQYDKALEFLTKSLTGREKVLGPEHESTLWTLSQIGTVYNHLQQYDKALEFLTKSLTGREKVLGLEHESTLWTLSRIGTVYDYLQQYDKALEFLTRALTGQEKVLGIEHESTLWTFSQIGTVYDYFQQYDKALEFLTKSLTGREKVLGLEHESTLWTLSQIGTVYNHLQQYDKALEFLTRALTGQEKVLGLEHELTLWTLSTLSTLSTPILS